MKVSLHLTRNCNLRCDYCYGGDKSKLTMSEQTAAQALDFLVAETADDEKLGITFFGGEPLLELKAVS